MTHHVALYVIAELASRGKTGWRQTSADDGNIVLEDGRCNIRLRLRYNSGNPAWFCTDAPPELRSFAADGRLFPIYNSPAGRHERENP